MARELETITSRQNALVVETHKLCDRKHRTKTGLFRFDGVKLAAEALLHGVELKAVLLRASDAERVMTRLETLCGATFSDATRLVLLADGVFDSLSEEAAPEGILCVAKHMTDLHGTGTKAPAEQENIMLLEAIRDPSNLGAIMRSAAAFGVDRLILSADCADIYHPRTVRASMGTLFSQRIDRIKDMVATIETLKASGRRVFAAALDPNAVRLGDFARRPGDCAVIGNEGHGLTAQTLAACDHKLYIPMTERAESLNAAVAASLLMWEMGGLRRQGGEKQ